MSTPSPRVSPAHLAIQLDPGDMLIVYSDGLTEAQPDLLMDRSALAALIDDTTSAAGIADRLIERGRAAGPLTDDLTIAVLRRSDPGQSTGIGAPATSAA